jgi:hypothetical protein
MNDFERKLSQQPFRTPPEDLREAILGSAAKIVTPPAWTWRNWLWPSPAAWAALAAVWVIFAAVDFVSESTSPAFSPPLAQQPSQTMTMLTFHQAHDINDLLNFPN